MAVADSRTARSAQSAFLPRSSATERIRDTASFTAFWTMGASSWGVSPLIATGWAAPTLVPRAIAATSAETRMNVPAEAARAPAGPTHTTTGTSEARIASMISFIAVSSPPGVSRTSTASDAPARLASRSPRTT